jgi:hypothetical protein
MGRFFCWLLGHRFKVIAVGQKTVHDSLIDCWAVQVCNRCRGTAETHRVLKPEDIA